MSTAVKGTEGSSPTVDSSSTKEAYLTLESFVLYKVNNLSRSWDFFPTPRGVSQTKGRTVVVLGDIPFPAKVPHPTRALTALYGFRDSLEEFQRHLRFARENGMGNIKVSFRVPVRTIVMGTTDLAKLATTDFLNLRRLQVSLTEIIVDGVNELLSQEKNSHGPSSFSKISDACQRPDLVCDVIRSEKIFQHIKAVSYMIPDETNVARGRQVVTLFSDRVETPTFRGDMPFDIVLPKLG